MREKMMLKVTEMVSKHIAPALAIIGLLTILTMVVDTVTQPVINEVTSAVKNYLNSYLSNTSSDEASELESEVAINGVFLDVNTISQQEQEEVIRAVSSPATENIELPLTAVSVKCDETTSPVWDAYSSHGLALNLPRNFFTSGLNAKMLVYYPEVLTAGERGTIYVALHSENGTNYYSTYKFVAGDDNICPTHGPASFDAASAEMISAFDGVDGDQLIVHFYAAPASVEGRAKSVGFAGEFGRISAEFERDDTTVTRPEKIPEPMPPTEVEPISPTDYVTSTEHECNLRVENGPTTLTEPDESDMTN